MCGPSFYSSIFNSSALEGFSYAREHVMRYVCPLDRCFYYTTIENEMEVGDGLK